MNFKRFIQVSSLVLTFAMLFSGCGSTTKTVGNIDFKKTLSDEYPVKDSDVTLTWWTDANPSMLTTAGNLGDTPFGQLLMEKTGIKIKFIHPAQGQTTEQFNLMISSGDYPDIIKANWAAYPGGPSAAIAENVIIPLNEILEKGGAPALKKYYDENPQHAAQLRTDDGIYFAFPSLADGNIMGVYNGGMIRKDLLDKAGLPVPETIEELDTALRAFKDMGVEIPLLINPYVSYQDALNMIISGYGIGNGVYVDEGKIKFGPLQPEYKQFVMQLNTWYKDGILDKEFATENNKRRDSLYVAGNIGVTWGPAGSVFGKLVPILKENVPGAEVAPISITHAKGQKAEFGHQGNVISGVAAISSDCEQIELAAKLLDYAYTDEGYYTWAFGKEGVSYNLVDGVPKYTDLITNPDTNGGLSFSEALAKYTASGHGGPYKSSTDYLMQYYNMPFQQEALKVWSNTNAINHILPVMYPTVEEATELAAIKADIDTYREEMLYKFISGVEPISKYDEFVQNLKNLKVDRMLEIQQNVYDRYLKKLGE